MKRLFLFLTIFVCVLKLDAQQEHQYTQFMYNKLLINPAYSGARGVPFLTALYRNQWIGFDGAPKSALVSFNAPFLVKRVGIGGTVSHRQIGLDKDFYGSLAYSYDLLGRENFSLRLGLMGSVRSFSINFGNASPLLPSTQDQSLATSKEQSLVANFGAGVYANYQDVLYAGFSVPNAYNNNISLQNPNATLIAQERPHFYAMFGGKYAVSEDLVLLPAMLLKYVKNAPFDADLNLNLEVKRKLNLGLSYRLGGDALGESLDLLVFIQATPLLGIGASYDFTLSEIRDHSSGSFEALIQYDLKQKDSNMSNPRFFF